ncbi:MAG TPA: hypothetical protein VKA04_03550, partial [Pseudodesulfovibrio sp.]|nr:hypothetical protein [Pseudodesulfovibrio sp.]
MATDEVRDLSTEEMTMELGVSGLKVSGGVVYEEFLRQLTGEQGRKVYREMSENDPTVSSMLYAMEMVLRGVPLEVEPYSEDPEDEEPAEFLESLFEDMSHSYHQFMSEWMATPTYGFAPFEVVYKFRRGKQATPGESSNYDDGKIGVRKLAIRHPDTLVRWLLDEHGGIQGMVQSTDKGAVTIPIQKMLLFNVRSRKGNPEGTSLLRGAYKPYYRKKRIEDIESIGLERDLAGLPHFTVPPEWMTATPGSAESTKLDAVKNIIRNMKVDEQAGIITPALFDKDNNPLFKFELVTSGGERSFDTVAIRRGYALDIATTTLFDVIMLGQDQVGSFALAKSKAEFWAMGMSSLLDSRDDVLNRHLVPRIMALNGYPLDRLPRFKHGEIEAVDLEAIGTFIQQLALSGHMMFPSEDGELERTVARMAGLPAPAPGEVGEEADEPEIQEEF